jgi:DNA-binding response OmpR family regulator
MPAASAVLLVEDEDLVRTTVARVLSALGSPVVAVASAEEGLAALRAADHEFRAVLLDVRLPGLSGARAAGEIRSIAPELPILLMSGRSDEETEAALELQGVHYLQKPFGMEKLAAVLDRIAPADETDAEK